MVFQDAGASLTPWLSVGELVAERLRSTGLSRAARRDAVVEVLERVGLPADVAKSRAGQLSGGERQRVAIALAIVGRPAVLLADEPTGNLDTTAGAEVLRLLRAGAAECRAVIMVTHETAAAEAADRVLTLRDGRLVP